MDEILEKGRVGPPRWLTCNEPGLTNLRFMLPNPYVSPSSLKAHLILEHVRDDVLPRVSEGNAVLEWTYEALVRLYEHGRGYAWTTPAFLAELANCPRPYADHAVRVLMQFGFITNKRRSRGDGTLDAYAYHLYVPTREELEILRRHYPAISLPQLLWTRGYSSHIEAPAEP